MSRKRKLIFVGVPLILLLFLMSRWGRYLLVLLFFNVTVARMPREEYQEKYRKFKESPIQVDVASIAPWQYREQDSDKYELTHRWYYLPSSKKNAPTMICLHGFNTDGQAFLGFEPLKDQVNIIAYNFPEETELFQGELSDFSPILADFFSLQNLDNIYLAGNSVGGAIAAEYANTQHNPEIRSLFLISSANFGAADQDTGRFKKMAKTMLPYEDYELYYLVNRAMILFGHLSKRKRSSGEAAAMIKVKKIGWYKQVIKGLSVYGGVPSNQGERFPVLILHGDGDRLLSLDNSRLYSRVYPEMEFRVIKDGRHSMVKSRAAEIVSEISVFIKEH